MRLKRFDPRGEVPEGCVGHTTVLVRGSDVLVVQAHPSELAPGARSLVLGALDGVAWHAVEAPEGDGGHPGPRAPESFMSLLALWGRLDEATWGLAGRAVQLLEWQRTHRFCGRCATPTEPAAGVRAMRCPACGLEGFPRLAPAVIVLVEREGEALLARSSSFPVPMYSCVAGFVEPGETLDDAVRREVAEEVGIELGELRYAGSQPWPFPHSLMVGFTAQWAAGEIEVDGSEVIDARWYRPGALPVIPPPVSIARALIDDWVARHQR